MSAVYENENFIVEVHETQDQDGTYGVRNKETHVVEFKDSQIANAITYAEHGNSFLKLRLWRLVSIQGAQSAEFLDKQSAEHELDASLLQP
jgi:hypothetical protein